MIEVEELRRLPSPAPKPQALAFDGETLWMASIATSRIYAIDPRTWNARDDGEVRGPGRPWGMTVVGDQLRVCYGVNEADDRAIGTYVPGRGFHGAPIPCPDGTGSHLSFDGHVLYLSQWYKQRIFGIDTAGSIVGTPIPTPHGICGHTVVGGRFFTLETDDEDGGDYWLTRIDARGDTPVSVDLARVPFPGRSLTWDGTSFWSAHREADQIVSFAPPPGAFD